MRTSSTATSRQLVVDLKASQGDRVYPLSDKVATLCGNAGSGAVKMGQYLFEMQKYIRKLTPIECERLQALEDGYTEGISNSQRYRCLGNGWTVDVVAHIFRRLAEQPLLGVQSPCCPLKPLYDTKT